MPDFRFGELQPEAMFLGNNIVISAFFNEQLVWPQLPAPENTVAAWHFDLAPSLSDSVASLALPFARASATTAFNGSRHLQIGVDEPRWHYLAATEELVGLEYIRGGGSYPNIYDQGSLTNSFTGLQPQYTNHQVGNWTYTNVTVTESTEKTIIGPPGNELPYYEIQENTVDGQHGLRFFRNWSAGQFPINYGASGAAALMYVKQDSAANRILHCHEINSSVSAQGGAVAAVNPEAGQAYGPTGTYNKVSRPVVTTNFNANDGCFHVRWRSTPSDGRGSRMDSYYYLNPTNNTAGPSIPAYLGDGVSKVLVSPVWAWHRYRDGSADNVGYKGPPPALDDWSGFLARDTIDWDGIIATTGAVGALIEYTESFQPASVANATVRRRAYNITDGRYSIDGNPVADYTTFAWTTSPQWTVIKKFILFDVAPNDAALRVLSTPSVQLPNYAEP